LTLLTLPVWGAEASTGIVTVLNGSATVIQGRVQSAVVEGIRIRPGALIETDAQLGLLRIEAGALAVDLGPGTRAMWWPDVVAVKGSPQAPLYLLAGWAKVSGREPGLITALTTPGVQVTSQSGVVTAMVAPHEIALFAEFGNAQVFERQTSRSSAPVALAQGEGYEQREGARGEALSRPSPSLLRQLPAALRDTLPWRAELFGNVDPTPKSSVAPSYATLAPWLDAEPLLRKAMTQRFSFRARQPEFRQSLIANLPAHPEWRPVLYPPEPSRRMAPYQGLAVPSRPH